MALEKRKRVDPPIGTCTITFGEVAENHVGMQKMGHKADEGLSIKDLEEAKDRLTALGYEPYIVYLNESLEGKDAEEAAVLVIPNGVKALGTDPDALKKEHDSLDVDKHAFMYGRVVNKRARFNLCFGDKSQEPDYEAKKGRVVAFPDIPLTNIIRESIPTIFGPKTKGLKAEGNYYYDPKKCGIGFHGDSERMIVIAVRLGPSIPLHYQWFYKNKPVGERIKLNLYHGDMYAMSTKATGNDWKRSSIYTLRHAAGCMKFTKP